LEIWGKAAFEQPFWVGRSPFGMRAMAHDPAAVRYVLLDNAANYRKDELQLKILSPGLGDGLLTAEGESWRAQRRALAPLFSPREVAGFAGAMQTVAARAVARLRRRRDGAVMDVGDLMSRVALEVLEETLFSQGSDGSLANSRRRSRAISTRSAASIRWTFSAHQTSCRGSPVGADARRSNFTTRRSRHHREPPRDVLTLLLAARDPDTGHGLPEASIRANIVTFINAAHETTANALTWTPSSVAGAGLARASGGRSGRGLRPRASACTDSLRVLPALLCRPPQSSP
jgi:cytochrome P450